MPQVGANNEPLHERALYGHDGTDWQKLTLLWGYSDVLAQSKTTASDGTSPTTVQSDVVPAGEIWVVTSYLCYHNDTVARQVNTVAYIDAISVNLNIDVAAGKFVAVPIAGTIVLKAGDYLLGYGYALVAGKTINLQAAGYKMKVA